MKIILVATVLLCIALTQAKSLEKRSALSDKIEALLRRAEGEDDCSALTWETYATSSRKEFKDFVTEVLGAAKHLPDEHFPTDIDKYTAMFWIMEAVKGVYIRREGKKFIGFMMDQMQKLEELSIQNPDEAEAVVEMIADDLDKKFGPEEEDPMKRGTEDEGLQYLHDLCNAEPKLLAAGARFARISEAIASISDKGKKILGYMLKGIGHLLWEYSKDEDKGDAMAKEWKECAEREIKKYEEGNDDSGQIDDGQVPESKKALSSKTVRAFLTALRSLNRK